MGPKLYHIKKIMEKAGKFMKKKKLGALALVLCGVVALSAICMGFAKWQTVISASGSQTASGNWDVKISDASLNVSTGAEIAKDYSNYSLKNVCASNYYGQACIEAAVPRTSTTYFPKTGTQSSRTNISGWLWLVDTTRFDMSKLGTLDGEQRRLGMLAGLEDGSVIRLSDTNITPDGTKLEPIKAWNYYKSKTDYFGDSSVRTTIIDGLVSQSDSLIKQLRPDTFYNYALICIAADGTNNCPHLQFEIGRMGSADGTEPKTVSFTDTEAEFSAVDFSLPDAWAEYTITVTNNGTAKACLEGTEIKLDTENPDQFVLSAPDLSDDVVAPGESCTITVVVKAADNGSSSLDAAGSLSIKLPYSQENPGTASSNHEHN